MRHTLLSHVCTIAEGQGKLCLGWFFKKKKDRKLSFLAADFKFWIKIVQK